MEESSSNSNTENSETSEVETVRTMTEAKAETAPKEKRAFSVSKAKFNPSDDSESEDEDGGDDNNSSSIEDFFKAELKRQEDPEESSDFLNAFPDVVRNERLDTVDEVTEPLSSDNFAESLPGEENAIRSSGNISSDFQADSLPPDLTAGSMNASITSKEEVYSVTEIEIQNVFTNFSPTKQASGSTESTDSIKSEQQASTGRQNKQFFWTFY